MSSFTLLIPGADSWDEGTFGARAGAFPFELKLFDAAVLDGRFHCHQRTRLPPDVFFVQRF